METDELMCQTLRISMPTLEKYKLICKDYKNDTVLIKKSPLQDMDLLKYYLLSKNLLKNECSKCKIPPKWNNKPLYLMIYHKNKVASDNTIENLEIICPNCMSQSDIANLKKNTNYVSKSQCDNCKELVVKAKLNDGLCHSCFEYKMNSKYCSVDDKNANDIDIMNDENIKNIHKIKNELYPEGTKNSRGLRKKLLESYNILRYQLNEDAKDDVDKIAVNVKPVSRTPIKPVSIVEPEDLEDGEDLMDKIVKTANAIKCHKLKKID